MANRNNTRRFFPIAGQKKKQNHVDRLNDRLHKIAMETGVIKHVRHLHPTKGYRHESKLRLEIRRMTPQERMSIHYGVIKKAQLFARKAG